MIAGYETKAQVLAMLEALSRERLTAGYSRADVAHNPQHLVEIERQQALFRAELDRMEAEGEGDEPKPEPWHKSFGRVSTGNLDSQYPDSMRR
jgi:hypothetical protein